MFMFLQVAGEWLAVTDSGICKWWPDGTSNKKARNNWQRKTYVKSTLSAEYLTLIAALNQEPKRMGWQRLST